MMNDPLDSFRTMLGGRGAANTPAQLPSGGTNTGGGSFGGGGGFGNIGGGGGGFGGGGMGAWETSVENRLNGLDGRLGGIDTKLGTLGEDVAGLKVRVDHLPTKFFSIATAIAIVVGLGAVVTFADQLRALVNAKQAATASATAASPPSSPSSSVGEAPQSSAAH